MARLVLIVNRFATGVTPERVERVEQALRSAAEVETRLTAARGDAATLAAEAAGAADAIVVFAGDGTANEAINGASGPAPFGFLPGGGASVFSRTLGLPRDPVEAAERVAEAFAAGRTRRVDLGRVNGRLFSFSAGIGLDGEIVRRVDARGRKADGRRPGDLAFVAAVLGVVARERARFEPRLEIEGRGRGAFVLVGCGRPYTYLGPLAIRLAPDDAALDFVAPRRVGPGSLPGFVVRLLRGRLAGSSDVLAGRGIERFSVLCDRPLPLQVDGEDLGDVSEAVFEAERDAIAVLA